MQMLQIETCQFFTCLPPFIGETFPGGPSHAIESRGSGNFTCCKGKGVVLAWYGGPVGTGLVLQKRVYANPAMKIGHASWRTVASVAGKGNASDSCSASRSPAELCYNTSESAAGTYRLYQHAVPLPTTRTSPNVTSPWVAWIDKTSYLGHFAYIPPDIWNPGYYEGPSCS